MSFTRQGKLKRRYKYSLILAGLFIMISSLLYFIQDSLIFRPTVLDRDFTYEFKNDFEEVFLKTTEFSEINAVHFKIKEPKGVILYCHGNMGDLSRWGLIAESFVDYGYDVFIYDYRTYGKSTGSLSEAALYEDAQFIYDHLKERYSEEEITLYGRSLGTGFAAYLASRNKPKQLLLETPYHSITDIAQHRFPFVPVKKLLKYKVPTNEFIKVADCPVYIIHGTDDGVVPFKSGEKLYKSASDANINFTKVEGGSHNDLKHFKEYESWLNSILK